MSGHRGGRDAVLRGYTVTRTLQTLAVLAAGNTTAAELAAALGVHTRTARRLLQRLVQEGWAERGPRHHDGFTASPALRELASQLAQPRPQ
jgi:DNA-binding IclR family transcriptional regulator